MRKRDALCVSEGGLSKRVGGESCQEERGCKKGYGVLARSREGYSKGFIKVIKAKCCCVGKMG